MYTFRIRRRREEIYLFEDGYDLAEEYMIVSYACLRLHRCYEYTLPTSNYHLTFLSSLEGTYLRT